jgi:outer membrane protein
LSNKVSPSVGLSLSIPIFQKKQASTSISMAKIGVSKAQLNEVETKNALRKNVEQAVVNIVTAQQQYEASKKDYEVTFESFEVATEKYNQGLMNSVDYLYEKTNLIVSESQLLQSKYNLIFSYKVLDFYKGERITL